MLNNERPSFAEVHLGDGFGLATTTLENGKEAAYIWGYKADADVTETRVIAADTGNYLPAQADSWAVSDRAVC